MSTDTEIRYGLAGVIADETAVSKVMQETNSLTYRGYPVQELCARCRFEEVAYLLLHGDLPVPEELARFRVLEAADWKLSPSALAVMRQLDRNAHPMDTLRTAVSLLGVEDPSADDNSVEAGHAKAVRLLARIPTIVAADCRLRRGVAPIDPDPALGFAENFFHMCFGAVPEPEVVDAFDTSLTLYAEHSFNASTFTARTVISTTSDLHSAVVAAIGALKGPLHGGANEAVMRMLLEIGEPAQARDWLLRALADKRRIMGFGHRVYRNGDSRVPTMTAAFHAMAEQTDGGKWVEMSRILADTMLERKGIHPNLDFPTGPAYYLMGFDIPMFTPIFVMSRITGWAAHALEQQANNKLIRPLSAYRGPAQRPVPAALTGATG